MRLTWRKPQQFYAAPHPEIAFRSASVSVGAAGPTDGSSMVSFLQGQIPAFNSWAMRDCKTRSRFPCVPDRLFSHLPLADNRSPQKQSLLLKHTVYAYAGYMLLASVLKKALCGFAKTGTILTAVIFITLK